MKTYNTGFLFTIVIAFGVGIGFALYGLPLISDDNNTSSSDHPLYWVAPMDANYKRDKPGKSPMGMDLVPVYKEADSASGAKSTTGNSGIVQISPEVINNLGVRTAKVTLGTINSEFNTVGYVQYDEDRLVHIHPRVEGWVEKLYVKAKGDPVEKGAPLYTLYSPTLVNAQEEYLLALRRNNSVLINAAKERLKALQVPESEINRIRSENKVSQTITITAPQSGVLDYLDAREGMYVQPGIKMMSIGDLQHLWVIGEVYERQISQIEKGDAVTISLDHLPSAQWQGNIDYIYPSLNEITRTAQVRIHIDNTNTQLRPGMIANLSIKTSASKDNLKDNLKDNSRETLLIPTEALIRIANPNDAKGEEQSRVVISQGDRGFKSIAVTAGQRSRHHVEILSGLKEGDVIVTSAQFLIDSESSKTSDFKRLSLDDVTKTSELIKDSEDSSVTGNAASVDGIIKAINHQLNTLTIARGPITQWRRPAAVVEFTAQPGINIHSYESGDEVRFTFELKDDVFTIVDIQAKENPHDYNYDKDQDKDNEL